MFVALIFSGCSKSTQVVLISSDYECEFEVLDSDFKGGLTVFNSNNFVLSFESPAELLGTTLEINGSLVLVDSYDYSSQFDINDIPQNSFILSLYNVFNELNKQDIFNNHEITVNNTNDNYKIIINNLGYIESVNANSNQKILLKNHMKT